MKEQADSTPLTEQEQELLHIRSVSILEAEKAARRRSRTQESELGKKRRVRKIKRILDDTYPYAVAELDFTNPFELLIATVLSAQTTDVRVNSVTPTLFASYPDALALAQASLPDVESIVQPLGFYRSKASSIVRLAQGLLERYDGEVPRTVEELITLPGVGRKTAFVVMGNAFGMPGLTVDTHFGRLARRFGMTEATEPERVEKDVAALFEPKDWTMLSHRMIYHGRRICHSRKPACGVCPVADLCPSYGEGETDEIQATKLLKYEFAPGRERLHLAFLHGATRQELRAQGWSLSA
ncbi:endonuclease III [Rothia sp. P6271]|uniref:endonuclease III n=1 Tax=unclassified Rothia (in: high G+C Gram-positive bacteria) TaxID=2689056 RepID=UPI003AC1BEE4